MKETNISRLVYRINSTYGQVNRNLQILETEGIIEAKYIGRIRLIQLRKENTKTQVLLKVLHILNRPMQIHKVETSDIT